MTWRYIRAAARLAIGVGAILGAGCGSRTPLGIDPGDGATSFEGEGKDGGSGVDVACFTQSRLVGEIPIDLYFMVDKSTSMNITVSGSTTTRWAAVSAAMKTFVNSPISAGLGAGMAFFPRADAVGSPLCGAADYAFPVVPIGTLPTVVPAMLAGIASQKLGTGTPTLPALQGAHIYARNRQTAQLGRVGAVVLVTDGEPRQCGSTPASTAAAATQAAGGSPSIKTYVLGVGPRLTDLHDIAEAGGTGRAYLVESGGEAELTLALDNIRTSALNCGYLIPEKGRKEAGTNPARVETRTGRDGAPLRVPQVASAEDCRDGPGWFYDKPPLADDSPPTRVTLCAASCEPLVKASGSHLDVTIGCTDGR